MELDPELIRGAKAYYRTRPVEFINHWGTTFDPRNVAKGKSTTFPFIMFPRQEEFVEFLMDCLRNEAPGLAEKSRDMGATWVCVAFSVWLWLFHPGAAIGWGSRKRELVDNIGDPSSIFEKIRMFIRALPPFLLPQGFNGKDHMVFMRVINPENKSTIIGEIGDDIGRGGRTLMYFKDESAHYERPESIEASLADNTRVPIDISSVNGPGNVFHRKREAGIDWYPGVKVEEGQVRVFVMDWSDHPDKTKDWYDARHRRAEREGLLHLLAQEVDRNYFAVVEGVIIPHEWVKAAVDAHKKLGWDDAGQWGLALDVADGGGDRNALAKRKGPVLAEVHEWGERDTGLTTRRAVGIAKGCGQVEIQYDCIGVGSGVKAEANRLADDGVLPPNVRFIPWNAGAAVLNPAARVVENDPDSPRNKDFYTNLKAQGWWELRNRFYRTYQWITEGIEHDPDDCISINGSMPLIRQLQKELSQATMSQGSRLKLVVNKTPEGTKSPNLADAVMMAFWPIAARKEHFEIGLPVVFA